MTAMHPSIMAQDGRSGYALIMAMVVTGISLLVLGGALAWSSANSRLAARNNLYFSGAGVAEAASEKAVAYMTADFFNGGQSLVESNLSSYQTLVPTAAETVLAGAYRFTSTNGVTNRITVAKTKDWAYTNLTTKYPVMKGRAATFRITSTVLDNTVVDQVPVAMRKDIQLAAVPLFEYFIFYGGQDMEFAPGSSMSINGRVHCNGNIYLQPTQPLTFQSHVTAAQGILLQYSPADTQGSFTPTIYFNAEHDDLVHTLNLPIGTNGTSTNLHKIIEVPPAAESTNSALGLMRMYNKADLVILVSNANSRAFSPSITMAWTDVCDTGKAKKNGKNAGKSSTPRIVATNVTFYDYREGSGTNVLATELDVSELNAEMGFFQGASGINRTVKTIYIADFRTSAGYLPAVRVVNAETLPSAGLTIVSPNPLYLWGNFNVASAHLGTTNTSLALPGGIWADAVTLLSDRWFDTYTGSTNLSSRPGSNTTVNAAIVAGVSPTGGGYYSGGTENLIRLQENWGGSTVTFNGSLVSLYNSQRARTGIPRFTSNVIYGAPNRSWSYDSNFLDPARLPPSTPDLSLFLRGTVAASTPTP